MQSEPQYEEQLTAYIDFLGTSDISKSDNNSRRDQLIELLESLAALRGNFSLKSTFAQGGNAVSLRPTISSFSDHIVLSYPLSAAYRDIQDDEATAAHLLGTNLKDLVTSIVAAALRIGFLVRGGVTVGKLFHSQKVIFGEAMVEAYELESRTAVYPRVVISNKLMAQMPWKAPGTFFLRGEDGLYCLDCFRTLLLAAVPSGDDHHEKLRECYQAVRQIIASNVSELGQAGRLNELAKWTWFSRSFRNGILRLNADAETAFGISLSDLPS